MLNERMKSMMWGIFHLRLRLINELEKVSWVRREKLPKDRRFFPRVGDIELSLYTYLLTYLLTYFTYFTYLLTYLLTYLFIYVWLCWVFVSARGLSPVVASGGNSSSRCAGLSLSRPLLLRSTGSRRAGSVLVAHGPSCSVACGIFPDQGSNPCPLHRQADSQPLHHQGSPSLYTFKF